MFDYVDCLTADSLGDTERTIASVARENLSTIVVKKGLLARAAQVAKRLWLRRREKRYAILAPCGRFTLAYLLLSFLFNVRLIVVEWGSIADMPRLDILTRASMKLAYRTADGIWYKEPYMEPLLDRLTTRPRFFIPNAVELSSSQQSIRRDGATFVWVNRMVGRRHPDVVVDAFLRLAVHQPDVSLVMAGALDESKLDPEGASKQKYVLSRRGSRLRVLDFVDPRALYASGRFFILVADEIFGNNALLEAMSAGLVPIVNDRPGISDFLTSGVNSIIIYDKTVESLTEAMNLASAMSEQSWMTMSKQARLAVATAASVEGWRLRFSAMLDALEPQ